MCTVDKLVLVGSLVARSDPFVLPQRLNVFVKFLRGNGHRIEDNLPSQLNNTEAEHKIYYESLRVLAGMRCDGLVENLFKIKLQYSAAAANNI